MPPLHRLGRLNPRLLGVGQEVGGRTGGAQHALGMALLEALAPMLMTGRLGQGGPSLQVPDFLGNPNSSHRDLISCQVLYM